MTKPSTREGGRSDSRSAGSMLRITAVTTTTPIAVHRSLAVRRLSRYFPTAILIPSPTSALYLRKIEVVPEVPSLSARLSRPATHGHRTRATYTPIPAAEDG